MVDASKLDSLFQASVDSKAIPGIGAILLDRSGKVLYKNTFGTTDTSNPSTASPVKSNTPVLLWSCTKVVACVALLQLLEQGKVSLSDPAEKYVPDINQIKVLDGFDDSGAPKLREPASKITVLQLLTHTAGFSYDFFDGPTCQWRIGEKATPGAYMGEGTRACFQSPLRFDPGTKYMYGVNIDWVGFIVEAISGQTLPEYVKANILDPLGMKDSGTTPSSDKRLLVHMKDESGTLTANADANLNYKAEVFGGGHYLYSTLDDYAQFLVALCNEGKSPTTGAVILKPETVKKYLFTDLLPEVPNWNPGAEKDVGVLKDIPIKPLSNDGVFMEGVKKGWSTGLMINLEDNAALDGGLEGKGRGKGSGAWAGLGNNYFWVDPEAGKVSLCVRLMFASVF